MKFRVVKVKTDGDSSSFEVANGLRLFGVWFKPGTEPVIQKIVVPLDESASNRYLNVRDQSVRGAVLKAVDIYRGGCNGQT